MYHTKKNYELRTFNLSMLGSLRLAPINYIIYMCVCVLTHVHVSFLIYGIHQMGYAMPTQINNGIHFRQYSRAFIVADSLKKTRIVFINTDICMGSQIIKIQVTVLP